MNVIGINASPRKNANTQTLVEAILAGAEKTGADTRMVNLRELKINGCLGCEGCKKHLGKCVQKDDLTTLLQDLTAYDAIVLGTPVYWFHVSAPVQNAGGPAVLFYAAHGPGNRRSGHKI